MWITLSCFVLYNILSLIYQKRKDMTNVTTATRTELEIAVLNDINLDLYVGGFDNIGSLGTEDLRERITNYVIEGNETSC